MTAPTARQSPPASQALAAKQRTDQEHVTVLLTAAIAQTWPIIEQKRLQVTLPDWIQAMYALIHRFGAVASTLAKNYLIATRPANLPHYTVTQHDPASFAQVSKSLTWATKGLYSAQPDLKAVQTLVEGVAQKAVQDAARNTYMDNVMADRSVVAWARDAKPNACAFCALLATRGPVYKTQASADFLAHDHCHCVAVPIYKGEKYVAPEYVDRWLALYRESTVGKSGAAARAAFRQALAHN